MIVTECPFNPERDLKPVEPFGFIDLQKAFVTGVVESQVPESSSDYNGIDDPEKVLGRPRDVFDALQSHLTLQQGVSSAEQKEEKSE